MALSGIQRAVLSLYRQCLRASRSKTPVRFLSGHGHARPAPPSPSCLLPWPLAFPKQQHCRIGHIAHEPSSASRHSLTGQAARPHFEAYARAAFRDHQAVEKRDFAAIEFLLRKGRRQLDVMSSPGIKDVK